jgi:hypothetical protein
MEQTPAHTSLGLWYWIHTELPLWCRTNIQRGASQWIEMWIHCWFSILIGFPFCDHAHWCLAALPDRQWVPP